MGYHIVDDPKWGIIIGPDYYVIILEIIVFLIIFLMNVNSKISSKSDSKILTIVQIYAW